MTSVQQPHTDSNQTSGAPFDGEKYVDALEDVAYYLRKGVGADFEAALVELDDPTTWSERSRPRGDMA